MILIIGITTISSAFATLSTFDMMRTATYGCDVRTKGRLELCSRSVCLIGEHFLHDQLTSHSVQASKDAKTGTVFAIEALNFEYMPGVMHAETHAAPVQCSGVLSLCKREGMGIQEFLNEIDTAVGETKLHVSFQKFAELTFKIYNRVVPFLESLEGLDYIAPMMQSLLGLFYFLDSS